MEKFQKYQRIFHRFPINSLLARMNIVARIKINKKLNKKLNQKLNKIP